MNQITRRSFLKTSAAASALAVNFVPSRVFGANERVRIGVAGINGRGQSHMGAYLGMKNVEVSHLIDPDSRLFKSRGKKVADKQGGKMPICVQDVREALEAAEVSRAEQLESPADSLSEGGIEKKQRAKPSEGKEARGLENSHLHGW